MSNPMVGRPPRAGQLGGLRRGNASAVLSALRANGRLSRSEIAAKVGLSPAAITKIMADLEHAGCITGIAPPEPEPSRGRGRPPAPVTLNLDRHRFLGVHVGMQRVNAGLVDLGGNVLALRTRKHRGTAAQAVLATARRLVAEVLEQSGVDHSDVVGYGACTGGWLQSDSGFVREFEGLGWHDVPFADGLRIDRLPAPRVESTVRALALTEARLATDAHNVLFLFVGNVIGCAQVADGAIVRGRHDAAGIIDHVSAGSRAAVPCTCGRHDCLWAVASDAALTAAARLRGLLPTDATVDDLVALSRIPGADGRTARRMLSVRAARVGTVVAGLIDIYDPDVTIIGGGELATSDGHFGQLAATVVDRMAGRERHQIPIRPAVLSGPSGLVQGAAAPALDAFYADPLVKL